MNPHHDGGARPPGPYWKRAHRDPKVWVAFVIIMIAMISFILYDGQLFGPAPVVVKP